MHPVPPKMSIYFTVDGKYHCPKCDRRYDSPHLELWKDGDIVAHPETINEVRNNGCQSCGFKTDKICALLIGKDVEKTLDNPLSLTMLGHVLKKTKRKTSFEPYFLYTRQAGGRTLKNVASVASTILGNSKVIFFDKIHALLTCLSSAKAGLTYTDTDSIYFSVAHKDIWKNCGGLSRKNKMTEWSYKIFADEGLSLIHI